jgi:hypothetical protein
MKPCSYCGRQNDEDAVECKECGAALHEPSDGPSALVSIRHRILELARRITKKQKRVMLCLGALLAAIAVYIASGYLHRPQLSEAEVIRVADAAAEAEGFRLNEYGPPRAKFEFPDRDRTWRVMYSLKLPTPWGSPLPKPQSGHGAPNHVFVTVNDKTGHTRVGMLRPVGPGTPVPVPAEVKVLGYYTNAQDSIQRSALRVSGGEKSKSRGA